MAVAMVKYLTSQQQQYSVCMTHASCWCNTMSRLQSCMNWHQLKKNSATQYKTVVHHKAK